jgi:hypothetical protein
MLYLLAERIEIIATQYCDLQSCKYDQTLWETNWKSNLQVWAQNSHYKYIFSNLELTHLTRSQQYMKGMISKEIRVSYCHMIHMYRLCTLQQLVPEQVTLITGSSSKASLGSCYRKLHCLFHKGTATFTAQSPEWWVSSRFFHCLEKNPAPFRPKCAQTALVLCYFYSWFHYPRISEYLHLLSSSRDHCLYIAPYSGRTI